MAIYCSDEFIDQYVYLLSKKNYKNIEEVFTDYFIGKAFNNMTGGDRLFGPHNVPFVKKRLPDSSGYRFYILLDFEKQDVYISYVHPKTGPDGIDSVDTETKKRLHKEILVARKTKEGLHNFSVCPTKGVILFASFTEEPKKDIKK